jgi:DNA-binding winged helix-turn-helix (wHTH) protein/methylmalonyl-CoA mutase cobalamin-binding subunit
MIRFGQFQIDPRTWLLTRDSAAVDLSPRLVEILGFIVSRSGEIVTKDELLEKFWPEVNVTENTLTRAIADIRKAIGEDATAPRVLQTAARRGYRFGGDASITPATDPFEEWVKGRLALDSLDASKLNDAALAFESATAELPKYAPAHAGLANAYLLQYERTRFGSAPNRELLARAMSAARQAAKLDPSLGEAWGVLGYLLCAAGKSDEGQAAVRRATALEPENWRHHYRLAYGTWGEERLRAVDRTLALMPGFAPARMLACMVFVARGTMDRADREASIGAETQRQNQSDHTPLPAVGFHWLRGLILATKGDRAAALTCFEEEIAAASSHVYGREFAVNAQVAIGFTRLADGDGDAAANAFTAAMTHPKSRVGMCALTRDREAVETAIAELTASGRFAEAALVRAGSHIVNGDIGEALATLDGLLTSAPAGPAGWIIPIDPMLSAIREHPAKQALFTRLAARAA